jgi:hypothetical protein
MTTTGTRTRAQHKRKISPLPCPFCGSVPQVFIGLGHHAVGCMSDDCPAQPRVAATGKPGSKQNTPERAIKRWNTRKAPR